MAEVFPLPDKVQEALQCPVCFNLYQDPRNLPCQHTYCKECIFKLVSKNCVTCPLCTSVHTMEQEHLEDLPRNFALSNVLYTLCEVCKQRQRIHDCSFCEKGLCICCAGEHEAGHNVEAEHSLTHLESQLSSLENETTQTKDETMRRADKVKAEIQRAINDYRVALNQREEELVEQVHSLVHQEVESTWQKQLRMRLRSARDFLADARTSLERNFLGATSIVPMSDLKDINERADGYAKELKSLEHSLPLGPRFVFSYSSQHMMKPISTHGTVTTVMDIEEECSLTRQMRSFAIDYYPIQESKYILGSHIKNETDADELKHPWSVDFSPTSGTTVVSDSENNKVYVFNGDDFIVSFGGRGRGNGQMHRPRGVVVSHSGNIYVADSYNNRIEGFDGKGNFWLVFGRKGSGNGMINQPMGLAMDNAGLLYVCDSYNYRVQVFEEDGTFVRCFGSKGQGSHQFTNIPCHIAVTESGRVFVTDRSERIRVFNQEGDFLESIDVMAALNLEACTLVGVCVDPSRNILMATEQGHILVMSEEGMSIQMIRHVTEVPHKHSTCLRDIVCRPDGIMLVCDCDSRTVQAFEVALHF